MVRRTQPRIDAVEKLIVICTEFTNVWETAYDVTDQTFDCAVNRTGTADNKMVNMRGPAAA